MFQLSSIVFASTARAKLLVLGLLCVAPITVLAHPKAGSVVCRESLPIAHRERLTSRLQKITGLSDLHFDAEGVLRTSGQVHGVSSASARELILNSIAGDSAIVLEEAKETEDVAFCRVIPCRWKSGNARPVFVVQLDFADFDHLVGDERALAAFNEGWGLLHELDHVLNDSLDSNVLADAGECEAHINQMRRECNLPERATYFATLSPLARNSAFRTQLFRIAFEQNDPARQKKRYWITWDGSVVGGLNQQVAALF